MDTNQLAVIDKVQPEHLEEFKLLVNDTAHFHLLEVNSTGEVPRVDYVKINDETVDGPDGQLMHPGDVITVGIYNASSATFEVEVQVTLLKVAQTEPPAALLHDAMEPADVAQFVVAHPKYGEIRKLLSDYELRHSKPPIAPVEGMPGPFDFG